MIQKSRLLGATTATAPFLMKYFFENVVSFLGNLSIISYSLHKTFGVLRHLEVENKCSGNAQAAFSYILKVLVPKNLNTPGDFLLFHR